MARKYFGTDGIRGTANIHPVTPDLVLRLALAAGKKFTRGDHRHKVVIGKDTRLSGYMLETALVSGFVAMGMDVYQVGPMPTPAVAMLTQSMRCDLGVMISASHNPFEDNGIKLFGPDGFKLSDETELEIEALMDAPISGLADPKSIGRAKRIDDAPGRYIEFVKKSFPAGLSLEGLRIVVDCANGAAYKVAPAVFYELGAEVIPISVQPDGTNINAMCGATKPQKMCETVVDKGAHLGVALDGDADRLIICDEKGRVLDGDQLMGLVAKFLHTRDALKGPLVATVMSNLGLERYLAKEGIGMLRTPVGDRYVVENMRVHGCNLGGEQSGHLVVGDHATTGDGILAALQVLAVLVQAQKPMSEVGRVFDPVPQLLKNIRFNEEKGMPLEVDSVKDVITAGEARLGETGRVLIRKSGTEPLIRVMAEGDDGQLVENVVDNIIEAISKA
ncbi:phosphoglucosamine mutase [Curvivirga aplysinae]|uniref:phosphoglucosamine mutase n=1 Tax=Curvivirga aplysinae TaxID=2529852 RepID=UPI0012BCD4F1|nr:phosphoglucosamine mutase [Curvivirga aplysinae]MTI09614.1 phosphoglucosamine mutase [Curvivirga aplysinae]